MAQDAGVHSLGSSPDAMPTLVDWWPMIHHDAQHSGVSTSTAPNTNTVLWSSPTGYWIEASPTIVDGKVFIGSEDHRMYCFDAVNGSVAWVYITGDMIVCSAAVVDGKVYFGSNDHNVYCLNESTGQLIWSYQADWCFFQSSPVVYDGKVYIGCHDYNLYCLDAETGEMIWAYPAAYYISSSPAISNGLVYFGDFNGILYCLDAETGTLVWQTSITYTDWTSSPTIADERLYVGNLGFELLCLDALTGNLLWTYETNDFITGSAAVYEGKVYIGSWDCTFNCLNATTGEELWSFTTSGTVGSSAAIADGKVYIGSSDHTLYCLDVETGNEIWEYTTGGDLLSSPAIAMGRLYIASLDNCVYCFGGNESENQPPIAAFSWTPAIPFVNQSVSFDASASVDPDGMIVRYGWDWDADGIIEESSTTPMISHVWSVPGNYPVTLWVTDNGMANDSLTLTVQVVPRVDSTPPLVSIKTPQENNISVFLLGRQILKIPCHRTIVIGSCNVSVTAMDNESGVARVEFYVNDVLQAVDTTEPYCWSWTNRSFNSFELEVVGVDNAGNMRHEAFSLVKVF